MTQIIFQNTNSWVIWIVSFNLIFFLELISNNITVIIIKSAHGYEDVLLSELYSLSFNILREEIWFVQVMFYFVKLQILYRMKNRTGFSPWVPLHSFKHLVQYFKILTLLVKICCCFLFNLLYFTEVVYK